MNVNTVIIAGNLTRDPEVKPIGQSSVAKFGVAINDKYKAADGTLKETTAFVDVEAWGKTADLVGQYLRKGAGVVIEGKLKSDSWQTKDGEKRQKLMVRADRVHFGSKREEAAPASAPRAPAPADNDDEPPF